MCGPPGLVGYILLIGIGTTPRPAGRLRELYDVSASSDASSTHIPGLIVEQIEMLFTYLPLLLGGLALNTASMMAFAFS